MESTALSRPPRARHHPDPAAALLAPGLLLLLFFTGTLAALVIRAQRAGNVLDSFSNPLVGDALRLSAMTSGLTLVLVLALGTPLAYALARLSFPGKRVVDTLVDLPLVLPPVVAGVALLMAFGRRGIFGPALEAAGIDVAFSTSAVVLAQVFVSAPFYVRAARSGFAAVDPGLEQIAYTLGASRLSTFFRVTAPLALPSLTGGAVLCWARAVSEFGATVMFAGNLRGETQTLPLAILSAMESNLFAALSISVIMLVLAFAVLLLFRVLGQDQR